MCHPFGHPGCLIVQNIKAANDLGIRVGQEWKIDLVPFSKVFQNRRVIVADGSHLDSTRFELLFRVLQLHELRFAKRSPIGGSEEKKNRAVRPPERLNGLLVSKLIARRETRRSRPNLQSGGR